MFRQWDRTTHFSKDSPQLFPPSFHQLQILLVGGRQDVVHPFLHQRSNWQLLGPNPANSTLKCIQFVFLTFFVLVWILVFLFCFSYASKYWEAESAWPMLAATHSHPLCFYIPFGPMKTLEFATIISRSTPGLQTHRYLQKRFLNPLTVFEAVVPLFKDYLLSAYYVWYIKPYSWYLRDFMRSPTQVASFR